MNNTQNEKMMSFKIACFVIASNFAVASPAQSDEALLDGVFHYYCQGIPITITKSEEKADVKWIDPNNNSSLITKTDDGWKIISENPEYLSFIRTDESNDLVVEFLTRDGFSSAYCIDLRDSLAEVFRTIRPRINDNAAKLSEDLVVENRKLKGLASQANLLREMNAEGKIEITKLRNELRVVNDRLKSEISQKNSLISGQEARYEEVKNSFEEKLSDILDYERQIIEQEMNEKLEIQIAAIVSKYGLEIAQLNGEFLGRAREFFSSKNGSLILDDRLVLSSNFLFDATGLRFSDEGRATVANLATLIRDVAQDIPEGLEWALAINAHSNKPSSQSQKNYNEQWELSHTQALEFLRLLIQDFGIPPSRLSGGIFVQSSQLHNNDTSQLLTSDGRIEIFLTKR